MEETVKNKNITVKAFGELSVQELYSILALRNAVFVVEQNCPYQDIDGRDIYALHVCLWDGDELQAYVRVVPADNYMGEISIGRVISAKRRMGFGTVVLKTGIEVAKEKLGAKTILIEAQVYAEKFYALQGFKRISDEFLEDGIPHVRMRLTL